MKKAIAWFFLCAVMLGLFSGCGDVSRVQIIGGASEIYTEADRSAAFDVVIDYFKKDFSGCALLKLSYIGDDKLGAYGEYAVRNGADEVIVLASEFDVGSGGGDGSLNPNETYKNWNWILVRDHGGDWRHVDHGYG